MQQALVATFIYLRLLSQLAGWEEELSGNGHPSLWNLSELGDIDRYADVIVFLHRPALYSEQSDADDEKLAIIYTSKNNNGVSCRARLNFHPEFMMFKDRANMDEDPPL